MPFDGRAVRRKRRDGAEGLREVGCAVRWVVRGLLSVGYGGLVGAARGFRLTPARVACSDGSVRRSCQQRRDESDGSGTRLANPITREWAPA